MKIIVSNTFSRCHACKLSVASMHLFHVQFLDAAKQSALG